MRKLLFVAAVFSLIMVSCQKDQVKTDASIDEVSQDVIELIAALGFKTNDIQKVPEGYLVEGDIIITDEDLRNGIGSGSELVVGDSEHYRTTNVVTGLPRNITIRVNSSLPTSYVTATNAAIARYNALGLRLTFTRVTSGGNIVINPAPSTATYLASAGFPIGGNPHANINVNRNYLDVWVANTVTSIIAHEIGHCIGLRHTDYMDRSYSCGGAYYNEGAAGVGAIHIPGTPTGPDANSWMLACIGNGVNRPFTANDIIALRFLYL
ncbi:M57 family metalloprotease [Gynurincola endophyticus]|uniref:M57 family metalloprotease n=1 Tax=Gynurincola endophyticus TaxID=2479004 RepID=UPI000F8F1AB1|nr:M57 family metalloprotease [Gynurincola endophyticus]